MLSYDKTETDPGTQRTRRILRDKRALDSVSNTSEDSDASLESVEDGYQMIHKIDINTHKKYIYMMF